jgi:lactate dehydrogenase-like 2-hydroxyacid dehydrogenase
LIIICGGIVLNEFALVLLVALAIMVISSMRNPALSKNRMFCAGVAVNNLLLAAVDARKAVVYHTPSYNTLAIAWAAVAIIVLIWTIWFTDK